MVDRVGFQVEGLDQVLRDLRAIGAEASDLKDAFAKIAAEGARVAEQYTPRRSGRLAAAVRGNRAVSKAVVRAGTRAVPYAGAINYGWPRRGIAAAQFMQKADETMRPRAVDLLEAEIDQIIRRKGLAR
jgi:hypothetical protein